MHGAKMKKRKRNSRRPEIPEDLIFNILKRLPAKSLMRFKTVCKAWHALIRDPYFAESHYTHSQARPDSSYLLFFLNSNSCYARAVFPTNPDGVVSTQLPTHNFDTLLPYTNIVNGIMCTWDDQKHELGVLNVTTGEKIALPRGNSMPLFSTQFEPAYFIGFDPMRKQYKVLYFYRGRPRNMNECCIITLGTESWRRAVNVPQLMPREENLCINGYIYWRDKLLVDGGRVIQYFDVGEEKFGLISVHDQVGNREFELTQVEGHLTVGLVDEFRSHGVITLWTLNKHDQEWIKANIRLPKSLFIDRKLSIVGSTNIGEILLTSRPRFCLDRSCDTLIFCNLLKETNPRTKHITLPLQSNGQSSKTAALLLSLVTRVAVSNYMENILPLKVPNPNEAKKQAKKSQIVKIKV